MKTESSGTQMQDLEKEVYYKTDDNIKSLKMWIIKSLVFMLTFKIQGF